MFLDFWDSMIITNFGSKMLLSTFWNNHAKSETYSNNITQRINSWASRHSNSSSGSKFGVPCSEKYTRKHGKTFLRINISNIMLQKYLVVGFDKNLVFGWCHSCMIKWNGWRMAHNAVGNTFAKKNVVWIIFILVTLNRLVNNVHTAIGLPAILLFWLML
jgi:hypothetical protein